MSSTNVGNRELREESRLAQLLPLNEALRYLTVRASKLTAHYFVLLAYLLRTSYYRVSHHAMRYQSPLRRDGAHASGDVADTRSQSH